MSDGATSMAGPPLPPPGEAGQPAVIIDGLACFDEWDTLALARLPVAGLLRQAMRWTHSRPGRA
jgi:hypothetical protein